MIFTKENLPRKLLIYDKEYSLKESPDYVDEYILTFVDATQPFFFSRKELLRNLNSVWRVKLINDCYYEIY